MSNRIFNVDDNYFNKIDNQNKAYILGLLYADGCNYENTGTIKIDLQIDDEELLDKIKNELKYTGELKHYEQPDKYFPETDKYYKSKDRLIDNARARESECVSQCGKVENSEIQRLYYHRVIANNIGYDALQSEFRDSREELDELVELMVDVLTADPDSTTYIAGQEMRTSVVQSRFLKLQQVHLEQVLLSLSKTTKQVTNMRSYLLTCLYQSFVTAHNEIRQEVNAANFA